MRVKYQVIWVAAGLSLAGCLSTAPADLPEDEFGEVGMSLRKGSGGVSGNDVDYCNDPAFLCVLGESDCDSDAQCEGALVCGLDNGPQFGHPFAWDSCVPVHCTNGVQDADETVTDCGGADCGTECGGVCGDVEPSPGVSACTNKCPCSAGESDCDADTQCAAGLVCGLNNGSQFGFPEPYDVCVAVHCTNSTQDGDETGVDCGGADCGTCEADPCGAMPANGDPNHCSNACPCPQGEGDCDSDAQCTGSGICGTDNGAAFGFHPAIDVCIADHCANGVKDGDELDIDCGPSCGDCVGTVTSYGNVSNDRVENIAVDAAGNTIIVGRFVNTISFGGAVLSATGPSTTAADIFVAKHAPDGTHLWSQNYGGDLSDGLLALNVAVGPSGEIAISGDFNGTVDFGGGPATANSMDGFVMVLESNGAFRWANTFGGAGLDSARGVDFDASGNVWATGQFTNSVDFGGGALTSGGDTDIFVVEYTGAAGAHLRSHAYGGAGTGESGYDIVVDGSSVYVGGTYRGSAMFGMVSSSSNAGSADGFVLQLSGTTLLPITTRFFGGTHIEAVFSLAVGATQVVAGGRFGTTVDFGGGNVVSAGGTDGFVLGLTKALGYSWMTPFGGSGNDLATSVAMNPADSSVFVAGYMVTNAQFGGTATTDLGNRDGLFAHVAGADGAVISVTREGGTGVDSCKSVDVNAGSVARTGVYQGTVNIGGSSITSAGGLDIYRVVDSI